ncbi:hypothetical protein AB0E11_18640 [Streptomyces fradiae]|uniref:hypothetical protein n=1 Tax=Streptomyces fradiae TaxID=1906 RepID=UPI0033E57BD4
MHLTPDQLVAEFHDAVMELYFARKRITLLEEENATLRARLAQAGTAPEPGAEAGAEAEAGAARVAPAGG